MSIEMLVFAGFEYYFRPVSPTSTEEHVLARIGDRNVDVSFVTHSDLRELMASIIASSVLCSLADGVLLDTESAEFVSAADALAWGKRGEEEIRRDLSARPRARRDAR